MIDVIEKLAEAGCHDIMTTARADSDVITAFKGFTPGSFDFFKKLRKNNRREWFAKHRGEYEANLLAPMKGLVFAAEEECYRAGLPLLANRRNPKCPRTC